MKVKYIVYIIILAFAFSGMAFYIYQVSAENAGLKQSIERVDKELERQKEIYQVAFDSIQKSVNLNNEQLTELKNQVPGIENRIDIINRKSNENKGTINRITNADTLSMLLTRRYRQ